MNSARNLGKVPFSDTECPAKEFRPDVETKTRSGGDDRACLARSLRAEKASSITFESRLAWLTRILLPPEPQQQPYNQPPPTLQPPADAEPRKMDKTGYMSAD